MTGASRFPGRRCQSAKRRKVVSDEGHDPSSQDDDFEFHSPSARNALDELDSREVCTVCKEGGHLIVCDGCVLAFHQLCHYPVVEKIPAGKWHCNLCSSTKSKSGQNSHTTKKASGQHSSEADDAEKLNPFDFILKVAENVSKKNTVNFDCESMPFSGRFCEKFGPFPPEYNKSNPKIIKTGKYLAVPSPMKFCYYCRKSCMTNALIGCSYCTAVFHPGCLFPPLESRPTDNWMCPLHVETTLSSTSSMRPSKRERLANEAAKNPEFVNADLLKSFSKVAKFVEQPKFFCRKPFIGKSKAKSKREPVHSATQWWSGMAFAMKVARTLLNDVDCHKSASATVSDPGHEATFLIEQWATATSLLEEIDGKVPMASTIAVHKSAPNLPVLAVLIWKWSLIERPIQKCWTTFGTEGADFDLRKFGTCTRIASLHARLVFEEATSQFLIWSESNYGIIVDDEFYGRGVQNNYTNRIPSSSSDSRPLNATETMAREVIKNSCPCAKYYRRADFADTAALLKCGSKIRIGCVEFIFVSQKCVNVHYGPVWTSATTNGTSPMGCP